jgi:hypothetical protein
MLPDLEIPFMVLLFGTNTPTHLLLHSNSRSNHSFNLPKTNRRNLSNRQAQSPKKNANFLSLLFSPAQSAVSHMCCWTLQTTLITQFSGLSSHQHKHQAQLSHFSVVCKQHLCWYIRL